ncbi:hypothetical protein [Metamycoplasma equirhinis]|uniref:hypothetical protein n=1 Tax=Metamycoplasma equirhinis TaxID=92402 RepID=UPI0035947C9C
MRSRKNGICFWRLRGSKENSKYTYSISSANTWEAVQKEAIKIFSSGKWDNIIIEQVKVIKILKKGRNYEKKQTFNT